MSNYFFFLSRAAMLLFSIVASQYVHRQTIVELFLYSTYFTSSKWLQYTGCFVLSEAATESPVQVSDTTMLMEALLPVTKEINTSNGSLIKETVKNCNTLLITFLTFVTMLSKKTKYAINALVYLAKGKRGEVIQISKIAESERISRKFLEAILLVLRNAGFLSSKKGMSGGYYLLQDPNEINIADVVRLFEGAIALLPCVAHKYYERCEECKDEATCGIRDVFAEIRNETVNRLKGATIQNILDRQKKLENELKIKE